MKTELVKAVFSNVSSSGERQMEQAAVRSAQEVNRARAAVQQSSSNTPATDVFIRVNQQAQSLQSATYQYKLQETRRRSEQVAGVVAENNKDITKVLANLIAPGLGAGRMIDRFA